MTTYERITYTLEGRTQRVMLRDVVEFAGIAGSDHEWLHLANLGYRFLRSPRHEPDGGRGRHRHQPGWLGLDPPGCRGDHRPGDRCGHCRPGPGHPGARGFLISVYSGRISDAVKRSVDVSKLAEAWLALHPQIVAKAIGSGVAAGAHGQPRAAGKSVSNADRLAALAEVAKAISPALATFLADAMAAIARALLSVLPRAWTEGWVLGQLAAQAVVSGLGKADWAGWTPGDYAARSAQGPAKLPSVLLVDALGNPLVLG